MARIVAGPLLTGRVVSTTGAPLGGVTVTPSSTVYTDPELSAAVTTLTTNGGGVFTAYARPGTYTFTCSDPSAAPIEPVEVLSSDEGGRGAWVPLGSPTADAPGIGAYFPEAHGAVGDGATDDTTAILAVDAAAQANGGTVYFQAGKTYRANGCLYRAYTGTTSPRTKPVRWTSTGGGPAWDGTWPATVDRSGSAILDLRYNGTDTLHNAKIDTRGAGFLEIDHLSIVSGGSDNFPMIQTTNTTLHVHDCFFGGNLANTGSTCAQDAIILGGKTLPIGAGKDAPFQGYGTAIHDCYFSRIRTAVYGGTYCNNAFITRLTASLTCGAADGTQGFITLTSGDTGNQISEMLIEANYYVYAIRGDDIFDNTIENVAIWDAAAGTFLGCVYLGGTSTRNRLSCAQNGSTVPFVVEAAGSTDKNEIYNPHQQSLDKHVTPITFPNVTNAGAKYTGGSNAAKASFVISGQTDLTIYRPTAAQLNFDGVDTTTTFRFTGQDLRVGANTNYLQAGSLGGTSRVYLRAEGSATDLTLDMRAKGTGRIELNSYLTLNHAPATSATAGSASALPATPQGYFTMYDNSGIARKVPFYVI